MTVALAIAAVAIVAATIALARGHGGELAEVHGDHPPLALPYDRPPAGTDVALLRLPRGLFGYEPKVTDEAMRRLSHALTERDVRIAELERRIGLAGLVTEHTPPAAATDVPPAGRPPAESSPAESQPAEPPAAESLHAEPQPAEPQPAEAWSAEPPHAEPSAAPPGALSAGPWSAPRYAAPAARDVPRSEPPSAPLPEPPPTPLPEHRPAFGRTAEPQADSDWEPVGEVPAESTAHRRRAETDRPQDGDEA